MLNFLKRTILIGTIVHDWRWHPDDDTVMQIQITIRYKYFYFPFWAFKCSTLVHGRDCEWFITRLGYRLDPKFGELFKLHYDVLKWEDPPGFE